MVSPAAIRRFTLSLDKSWGSRGSCLGKGQAEPLCVGRGAYSPRPSRSRGGGAVPLPVQDGADVRAGADGEEQRPSLQGCAEQALQAGGDHRARAPPAAGPAENTF